MRRPHLEIIKMNKNVFLPLLGIAIVAAGCTMAPKYTRPNAPVPAEWPNGVAYASQLSTTTLQLPKWQEFITDEKLQQSSEWP